MDSNLKICNRCIMDTTDPDIIFDKNGICNHCKDADKVLNMPPYCLDLNEKTIKLQQLADEIKLKNKHKKYDCIIGVSGGVDSTYVAYIVKKLGLRPLAIHLDNGWNSELAVQNIENTLKKLDIDLFTYVIDWEEFRDLQLSFLKASTPDSEIPSDHAIFATLYKIASKNNIQHMFLGTNVSSESILPRAWSFGHADWKYIKNIQKKFGTKKLKTFPHYSLLDLFYYIFVKKIQWVNTLNYLDYDKNKAKEFIKEHLDWRDYGGKHHESNYTKIYQAYILPTKFGYDKRKAHLSSLIIAGQITRDEALAEMTQELYSKDKLKEDLDYLINKFQITNEEFQWIMDLPKKKFSDYKSYFNSCYYPREGTLFYKVLKFFYKLVKHS